ncbi:molybdopterin oxidoreductase family protein [Roseateles asaccharophilus]|uniref:Anaerobic selenocysteine-containing dehydrogenase n=1 Tax=Roseateles asaccharophilus TaxID=582607 RepID=A0ABU2A955_9BURK|nr:molybdopterin oxidoreductase family protein [Roseateles asaccharophilus]MDR7333727.1 anaerobic selenocysteine-containing dehydrogenase [Roseateles asaccharophilus]
MTTRTVHGACPHDCPDTCALQVTVENERVIKVQGRAEHPNTHGALCTKVSRYPERTYHAERLLHPLKRISKKTEAPQFVQVSWAEAIADIAARLKAIADPQCIQPYSYAGTMGLIQGEAMAGRLWNALGAARLDRTICASAGGAGLAATYGHKLGMHTRHFAGAKLIIIWGSNSITSNLHFWTYANQAKREGAKLICIDPRKTETADKCHQHIAVLPGTDGALALGLMHELIQNGWLNQDYIANYVDGWDELRAKALAWPPERVAEVCGITADEVRGLARDYGDRDVMEAPAAIRLNYGMQRVRGGGNAVRLIALLPCLTGAWRHESGGMLLSASGWNAPYKNPNLERPDLLAGRTPRMVNMSTIGDALLQADPPIQALVVYNSNPVAVAPESPKVVAGFQREDLFTVVLEHFMTDTADLADYVLPATTQLEHLDVHTSYGHTDVLMNQPAVAPLGEAKTNTQIFRELAAAMGLIDPCFSDSDDDLAAQAFTSNIDMALLREQGWQPLPIAEAPFAEGGFRTPNGRAQAAGADYVPNYESALTTPELATRYPLAMISPPARNFLNSSFVNVKSLRDIESEPIIEMHADDAAARQLADGARVAAFNDRGRYVATLRVSKRARPGVVNGLGVWWRKLGLDGTNVNEVTHQHLTDLGNAPAFYDCLVEVEAA